MKLLRIGTMLLKFSALAAIAAAAFLTREAWLPFLRPAPPPEHADAHDSAPPAEAKVVLTDRAIENLGLVAKPLAPESFWRTISVPGTVVDRPGHSDRNIVAPVAAVVVAVYRVPGESVRSGEELFVLRPLSETFHQSQTELYKAVQDIKLTQALRKRLESSGGVVPEARLLELDTQITRLEIAAKAYRQELQTRGLTPDQIDAVSAGNFVKEIRIAVPAVVESSPGDAPSIYEVQELKVSLGQQVQAGQTLGLLADHEHLAVEGRAFADEAALVERALKSGWPVEADILQPPNSDWPASERTLKIAQMANVIDPDTRTFAFLMPLQNQSREFERDGRTLRLWRYRPGQPVRLRVPVERIDNVFVLPADAVIRDGPEAFVFLQNANTFERRSVRVLFLDRTRAVLANDGAVPTGAYVAQSSAAQLNRMAKSPPSDVPKGYHMHADGSLHKNHD